MAMPSEPRNSKVWYLAPILFSIIGGILMYVLLRKENPSMAKNGLVVGAAVFVVGLITVGMLAAPPLTGPMTFEEGFRSGYEQGYDSATRETGPQDYAFERAYEPPAFVETPPPQRAQSCSLFCDSTGYEPAWAKNMGQMQASSKCMSIDDYGSRDSDWCLELSGYMLDEMFGDGLLP